MEMSTVIGWVLGGFACRIYAAGAAVWAASEAMKPLAHVAQALRHLP